MAKKRVHELAKQYNMPTAEVMKRLNAAGIAVKATASAVDEVAADAALTGKKQPQNANGKGPSRRPRARSCARRAISASATSAPARPRA